MELAELLDALEKIHERLDVRDLVIQRLVHRGALDHTFEPCDRLTLLLQLRVDYVLHAVAVLVVKPVSDQLV